MIKTLRGTNGSAANVGAVQVQPAISDLGHSVKQQTTQVSHQTSPAKVPPSQAIIVTPALFQTSAKLQVQSTVSIDTVVASMISDKTFMLPPFHSEFNTILPSFAKSLQPASLVHPNTTKQVVTTKKFEPYEQLTGIAHERPEIVMLTNFLPLFTKEVGHSSPSGMNQVENGGYYPFMTDAGRFMDTYLQASQLHVVNSKQMIRDLRSKYAFVANFFASNHSGIVETMNSLSVTSNFLLGLVQGLFSLKAKLDMRNDIHSLVPATVARDYFMNFTKINNDNSSTNVLIEVAQHNLPPKYTISDTLVRLGYRVDSVKNVFSSTKIWLQVMLEMKNILQFHSAEFLDIDPVTQRLDSSATSITTLSTPLFDFGSSISRLLPLTELSTIPVAQIGITSNTLNLAWQSLYKTVHFKSDEAHIAALANLVSKEFRYSFGLSLQPVQQALNSQYNYSISSTVANTGVFDSIVGDPGNNITDISGQQANSLMSVARRVPEPNISVLTFESKYVDGDTGTLTPGGTYYVDQVMKTDGQEFDTNRLDLLGNLFDLSYNQFGTIVSGMNLLATPVVNPDDKKITQFSTVMSSPLTLAGHVLTSLIDTRNGNTLPAIKNDNLGAVYSYAIKNNQVKSLLFMLSMARVARPGRPFIIISNLPDSPQVQNTPLTDALVDKIIDALVAAVPQALAGSRFLKGTAVKASNKATSISRDTIKASFKSGTALTKLVDNTMHLVLGAFQSDNHAMLNGRTRYSGELDTTIMMATFDMVIQMIAKYDNQAIVSAHYGNFLASLGTLTFNISKTTTNWHASFLSLFSRIEKEIALIHQLVYATLNSLKNLAAAIKSYSNYLKSPPAKEQLREVSSVIDDPTLFNMLMSEQQIMLMASTAIDLSNQFGRPRDIPISADVDGDGDFDIDDEMKIIDDSAITPKLRNAVYGMFGAAEFASKQGYNKKILTIGIPLGFTERLKQRVSITHQQKSTFIDKQGDIVNLVIYKVDLENSDIVYKPKRVLVELTRFPIRNDRFFLDIPDKPTLNDIVHALPTRDLSEQQSLLFGPTYWTSGTDSVNKGLSVSFTDASYSFLSAAEKQSIAQNHVLSYLLEVYIRLLTGVSVAEYHFDLVEPPRPMSQTMIQFLTEHYLALVSDNLSTQNTSTGASNQSPLGGVLFTSTVPRPLGYTVPLAIAPHATTYPQMGNSAGVAGTISRATQFGSIQASAPVKTLTEQESIGSVAKNMSSISQRHVAATMQGLRTISNSSRMLSSLSDPLAVSKRIVSPKQFDRVFNVVIDPDEFEIDYAKTIKTPQGKQALQQMIRKGDIIPETENHFFSSAVKSSDQVANSSLGRPFTQGRAAPNVGLFRYRDRDKNQGDLTFEKYFVTVETYEEEEV